MCGKLTRRVPYVSVPLFRFRVSVHDFTKTDVRVGHEMCFVRFRSPLPFSGFRPRFQENGCAGS